MKRFVSLALLITFLISCSSTSDSEKTQEELKAELQEVLVQKSEEVPENPTKELKSESDSVITE